MLDAVTKAGGGSITSLVGAEASAEIWAVAQQPPMQARYVARARRFGNTNQPQRTASGALRAHVTFLTNDIP